MKSNKCLCCGMLIFNLPDDFNGTRADALRLVADYIEETESNDHRKLQNITGAESYNELTDVITNDLFENENIKLKMIGLNIVNFED